MKCDNYIKTKQDDRRCKREYRFFCSADGPPKVEWRGNWVLWHRPKYDVRYEGFLLIGEIDEELEKIRRERKEIGLTDKEITSLEALPLFIKDRNNGI